MLPPHEFARFSILNVAFKVDFRSIKKINETFSETKNSSSKVMFATSITNEKGTGLLFPNRQSAVSNLGQECRESSVCQFAKFTSNRTF